MGGIIPCVSHLPTASQLDLSQMQDLGLSEAELQELLQTLVADLTQQLQQLQYLLAGSPEAPNLHRQLHTLKGMAGLLGQPALVQAITQADDASRAGDLHQGRALAHGLCPLLERWLADAQGWLQRYSST